MNSKKLAILGGGQLARMMVPTLKKWDIDFCILDKSGQVAEKYCDDYRVGSFLDPEDVAALSKDCHVITYDLENVSTAGLEEFSRHGGQCAPPWQMLKLIQDKGKQKQFFVDHGIATSDFKFCDDGTIEESGILKLRTGGYDGKGVHNYKLGESLPDHFRGCPLLWEEKVPIDKEISIIVVRSKEGSSLVYDPVEMVFDKKLNLIDYTLCPAQIESHIEQEAKALAVKVADAFGSQGVLAVEMFLTKQGQLLVNEVAPRPHNSGHFSIEGCLTSQFENHLRGVLELPLGETKRLFPWVLTFNILGSGKEGLARVQGLEDVLKYEGVFVHIYGKSECRPGRKMGHVTVAASSQDELLKKYTNVKNVLTITGQ